MGFSLLFGVWGLGFGLGGLGFDRTCVVRSMKQGIAYRGDTNDLRLAASSTALVWGLGFGLWALGFGAWGLGFGAWGGGGGRG